MNTLYMTITLMTLLCTCSKDKILKIGYSGADISKDATITCDQTTKETFLNLSVEGKWAIYAGKSVETIEISQPICSGEGSGTYKLNITNSTRNYYQLVTDKGQAILAESHLPMEGGYNFRDLGGIRTSDGHYVKWGKLIRSDELKNLTNADLQYLANIPIISLVDFRSEKEIAQAPDLVPSSVRNNVQLSITPGNVLTLQSLTEASVEQLDRVMININESLVSDTLFVEQYKAFFKLVQDGSQTPLLFHCTAGKDRTGMGAALILMALGVDEESVIKNYLASNQYLKEKYAKEIARYPKLESVLTVKKEFLQAGILQMKKDHGSVEDYLTKILDVDIVKLKELHLY